MCNKCVSTPFPPCRRFNDAMFLLEGALHICFFFLQFHPMSAKVVPNPKRWEIQGWKRKENKRTRPGTWLDYAFKKCDLHRGPNLCAFVAMWDKLTQFNSSRQCWRQVHSTVCYGWGVVKDTSVGVRKPVFGSWVSHASCGWLWASAVPTLRVLGFYFWEFSPLRISSREI